MQLALIADSTCDLPAEELEALRVQRVPLYVHFRDQVYKDWVEITPPEIVEGVRQGADVATTSQPTPEDFAEAYREAAADGAEQALVITLTSDLSGTHQSATLAAKEAPIPVTVYDSRHASIGTGQMVKKAARWRDAGASLEEIVAAVDRVRASTDLIFTVGTLEYLKKGGRIGRASAMVGNLLNIRPLLTLQDGVVTPAGRARGPRNAIREIVSHVRRHREAHPGGELVLSFLQLDAEEELQQLREALQGAGVDYRDGGAYQLGAVISVHVGPGVFGSYAYVEEDGAAA